MRLDAANRADKTDIFYRALAEGLDDPAELALLAGMAEADGNHQLALQIGKTAASRAAGHPRLPDLGDRPRPRPASEADGLRHRAPESAFNPGAISRAGAQGLLQLMPATAGQTATFPRRRGSPRPAQRHPRRRHRRSLRGFGGSYVMTFAAYNAGGTRVRAWVGPMATRATRTSTWSTGSSASPSPDPQLRAADHGEPAGPAPWSMKPDRRSRATSSAASGLTGPGRDGKRGASRRAGRRDVRYRSFDGLSLHAMTALFAWLPILCLPGLSRTARDFDSSRPSRRAPPAGRAGWSPSTIAAAADPIATPTRPALVEMTDVLGGMAALDIPAPSSSASRGGIITMLMGVARPVIAGAVLTSARRSADRPRGSSPMSADAGTSDWDDAVALLKRLHGPVHRPRRRRLGRVRPHELSRRGRPPVID